VAIASRVGVRDVIVNFGEALAKARTPDVGDDEPLAEARMISAICGDVRVTCIYAPNGRVLGSPFYQAKLAWFGRLERWFRETRTADEPLLWRRQQPAPTDDDVGQGRATAARTSRQGALGSTRSSAGPDQIYRSKHGESAATWWDYRAGNFTRTSACASTTCS
jgi:exodeoxyribonuclease-3